MKSIAQTCETFNLLSVDLVTYMSISEVLVNTCSSSATTAKIWNFANRPRSIYQYCNMVPRLSEQMSIFGVVFFVSKSLLGIERQKKLKKFAIFTRKPRSHVRILIYRTWPIFCSPKIGIKQNWL